MRNRRNPFILAILLLPAVIWTCPAQSSPAAAAAGPTPTAPAPATLTGTLKPALDAVKNALDQVKLDKWKRGTVREGAGTNIAAIQRELKQNLPPLLQQADADPSALSKALPVSRHISALYDVYLRVVEASRVAAPGEQVDLLEKVQALLEDARLAFDARLQDGALAMEKQVGDLRTALKAASATPPKAVSTVASNCPASAQPAHKPVRKRKPAAKPATTTPAPAKPNPAPANPTPAPAK
jgi:hypothetical protein